jgi:hypothetical protein
MIGSYLAHEINNHRQESERYETFYRSHQLVINDNVSDTLSSGHDHFKKWSNTFSMLLMPVSEVNSARMTKWARMHAPDLGGA